MINSTPNFSYEYSNKITGKCKNPFTIRVIDEVFISYIFLSSVESFSKLDAIVIILKTAHKNCDYEEIYSKLHEHLTMTQFMKFMFELKKYNLLKSMNSETHYVTTPKGIQYLQIHNELTGQMRSETRNSRISDYRNTVLKLTNFFKKKNNILESI